MGFLACFSQASADRSGRFRHGVRGGEVPSHRVDLCRLIQKPANEFRELDRASGLARVAFAEPGGDF